MELRCAIGATLPETNAHAPKKTVLSHGDASLVVEDCQMKIVRYHGTSTPRASMRIVIYPPACMVRLLGNESQNVLLWMHWRGKHAFPCQGADCQDCGVDKFPYGYAPVQTGKMLCGQWRPALVGILPVTGNALDLLKGDCAGKVVEMYRSPNSLRGATCWREHECSSPLDRAPFDVLSHLHDLWAYFAKKEGAGRNITSARTITETQLADVLRGVMSKFASV